MQKDAGEKGVKTRSFKLYLISAIVIFATIVGIVTYLITNQESGFDGELSSTADDSIELVLGESGEVNFSVNYSGATISFDSSDKSIFRVTDVSIADSTVTLYSLCVGTATLTITAKYGDQKTTSVTNVYVVKQSSTDSGDDESENKDEETDDLTLSNLTENAIEDENFKHIEIKVVNNILTSNTINLTSIKTVVTVAYETAVYVLDENNKATLIENTAVIDSPSATYILDSTFANLKLLFILTDSETTYFRLCDVTL